MMKKMKSNVKDVVVGALIFALAMGFTFANCELANAAAGTKVDPLVSFRYALEIDGKITGYFSDVRHIGSEHEIVEQKITDTRGQTLVRKIPGRLKFSDVILIRGIISTMDMANWRQLVVDGKFDSARKDVNIIMMDETFKEVARWKLTRAWPSKLIYNPVDSSATGIEQIVITSEGFVRVK